MIIQKGDFMLDEHRYTPQQALFITRAITKQLNADHFGLHTPGVFRVAGRHQFVMQIVNSILNHKKIVNRQYSVHDYVGALKFTLMNSELISIQDPWVHMLRKQVVAEDLSKGIAAINEFIKKLSYSNDRDKYCAAEVIYQYLHLLTATFRFQAKNKMTAEHLGIIAGPFFARMIEQDPIDTLFVTLKVNQLCSIMVANGYFKATFDNVYNEVVEKWQERDLTELEQEREMLKRLRARYAARATIFQDEITRIHK